MDNTRPYIPLLLLAAALLLSGCVMRPEAADGVEEAEMRLAETPEPGPVYRTVEFRQGDLVLSVQAVEDGALPQIPDRAENARLLGWIDESGARSDPAAPVTADAVYYADTRPLLQSGSGWLRPDEHGLLAPEDPFTRADAFSAVETLLEDPGELDPLTAAWSDAPDEALSREELRGLLYALFDCDEADSVLAESFPTGEEDVTRARAAFCLSRLLGAAPQEDFYYPDAAPDRWAYSELSAAAAPGVLDRESLRQETLDGFLWFDGYLYRLDEEGWFLADVEYDGLRYGPDGRFTSGDRDLDRYVAETITRYAQPGHTRLERLKDLYLHVKNDFKYLVRNYYASGDHGWEIPEALTLYETGKGNCYCYAGVFWSLARGMGYNASAYSGTMGNQNQPHAWTEISLDGEIYICDPEIEMNYWSLARLNGDNSMYTDNFMMLRRTAGGWNYQSVGRE